MIRRPPRSTLFPTRRSSDLSEVGSKDSDVEFAPEQWIEWIRQELDAGAWKRSEEHTSELQSQSNLVCRLLLEKKKNNKNEHRPQHKIRIEALSQSAQSTIRQ